MGEIEVLKSEKKVIIHSEIFLYGDSATEKLTKQFGGEIEQLWNEVDGTIELDGDIFNVEFSISSFFSPNLTVEEVMNNTNPRKNYFRVEDYSPINISWVDGIGSNTGYMLLGNLYEGSTTASHEYGHTLGLEHPQDINYIGKGRPGIMYPRGSLVDPEFQYDPTKQPGENGGTIHPMHRRVNQVDIDNLKLPQLIQNNFTVLGSFTSVFHPKQLKPEVS